MTTEIDAEGLAKLQADACLPHPPTQDTYWYRMAIAGEGPHAFDWTDKPHRLVYDLCRIIEAQAAQEPPPAHPEDFDYAALLTSLDYKRTKWVVVPHGQSLDFDDDDATRRWLQPHLGKEWSLTSFVSLRDPLRAMRATTRTSEAEPVAYLRQHSDGVRMVAALNPELEVWQKAEGGWTVRPLYTLPTPASDDQVEVDYFGSLVERARAAAAKASVKFPQPNYVTLKIAEEAGEVVRGAVHYAENRMEWSEVEGEIVQLLAMLIRFVTEGDQINGVTPPAALAAMGSTNP